MFYFDFCHYYNSIGFRHFYGRSSNIKSYKGAIKGGAKFLSKIKIIEKVKKDYTRRIKRLLSGKKIQIFRKTSANLIPIAVGELGAGACLEEHRRKVDRVPFPALLENVRRLRWVLVLRIGF